MNPILAPWFRASARGKQLRRKVSVVIVFLLIMVRLLLIPYHYYDSRTLVSHLRPRQAALAQGSGRYRSSTFHLLMIIRFR